MESETPSVFSMNSGQGRLKGPPPKATCRFRERSPEVVGILKYMFASWNPLEPSSPVVHTRSSCLATGTIVVRFLRPTSNFALYLRRARLMRKGSNHELSGFLKFGTDTFGYVPDDRI